MSFFKPSKPNLMLVLRAFFRSSCLQNVSRGGDGGTLNLLNVRVSEIDEYMAQQNLVVVQTIHYGCPTLQPRAMCITVQSNNSTKYAIEVFTGRTVYSRIQLMSSFLQGLNNSKRSVLHLVPYTTR